ncbi:uncharacterized protein BX664DRAFT_310169 [Halteromyces radiatus]|uniref:uncharacterized protein n=1 Tax=Halteromyces radiatus TaxID=101107 RepID=UPI0022206E10|nr:uncharacterized protein BX664DRAFT_310169 [Halteromyces radiatus]KAI8099171.1 hypothetical protein BX664DRAFT_310169 [Halteromyces radiatus]
MNDVELSGPSLYEMTHQSPTVATINETLSPSLSNSQQQVAFQQAQQSLYDDIREARHALDLFLNSNITECLDIVIANRHKSMYHSLSYACLLGGTAVLTYQKDDIAKAIIAMKDTYQLADKFRTRTWKQHFRGINKRVLSIQDIKKMTPVQKHAELVYAEAYLMKAGLQILYDQNFVLALKEGLKAYLAHGIYKSLENYMLHVQKEAGLGKDVMEEYGLDGHLISGIAFGMAGFNLALSAVPEFLLRLVEYVGFQGDRSLAMWYCTSLGGWNDNNHEQQGENEGLRRQFCDMILMGYNVVLCKLTRLSHVDEVLGDRILTYHLKKYPNGVIFLALKGRQLATQRKLEQAKVYYQKAMDAQDVWPQLQDIPRWELGTLALVEQNWRGALEVFQYLLNNNSWSKAVYTYMHAVSLYMFALETHPSGPKRKAILDNVTLSMKSVTKAKQKIAGKSIFIEKFFARKSRKYDLQGNRLLFPDLEILLSIGALELMPVNWIHKNLIRIDHTLKRLETSRSFYVHDDICLSHLLRATLYRLLLEQEEESITTSSKLLGHDELRQQHPNKVMHRQSIQVVMDHAPKVQLDHWIYYFARYEKAQLLIVDRCYAEAKRELDCILRHTEKNDFNVGAGARAKSKYSMENALILKCHSCLGYIAEVATKGTKIEQQQRKLRSYRPVHHRAGPTDTLDDNSCITFTGSDTPILPYLSRKNSI